MKVENDWSRSPLYLWLDIDSSVHICMFRLYSNDLKYKSNLIMLYLLDNFLFFCISSSVLAFKYYYF